VKKSYGAPSLVSECKEQASCETKAMRFKSWLCAMPADARCPDPFQSKRPLPRTKTLRREDQSSSRPDVSVGRPSDSW